MRSQAEYEVKDHKTGRIYDLSSNTQLTSEQLLEAISKVNPELSLWDKTKDLFTGELRETEETRNTPELFDSDIFGDDIEGFRKNAAYSLLAVTMSDKEKADIIKDTFPNIEIRQDKHGTWFAKNTDTGAEAVINKPGWSMMDTINAGAEAALFAIPIPGLGSIGKPLAKATVKKALAQTAKRIGSQASQDVAKQSAIEVAQNELGGDVDLKDIAIAGGASALASGVGEGAKAYAKNKSNRLYEAQKKADADYIDAETDSLKQQSINDAERQAFIDAKKAEIAEERGLNSAETEQYTRDIELEKAKAIDKDSANLEIIKESMDELVKSQRLLKNKKAGLRAFTNEVDPDLEIINKFDELGLLNDTPTEFYSKNPQFQQSQEALKVIKGSDSAAKETQFFKKFGNKIDEFKETYGGNLDPGQLSEDLLSEYQSSIKALTDKEQELHGLIKAEIDDTQYITPTNTLKYLEEKIDKSGEDILKPMERRVYNQINYKPSYHAIEVLRDDVGRGLLNRDVISTEGKDNLLGLYHALKNDKADYIRQVKPELSPVLETANKVTQQRFDLLEKGKNAYGRNADKAIMPQMVLAINQLSKGNTANFDKLMKVIPPKRRQETIVGALSDIFKIHAKQQDTYSNGGFSGWFRQLRTREPSVDRVMKYLPKEARKRLNILGDLSIAIQNSKGFQRDNGSAVTMLDNFDSDLGIPAKLYGMSKDAVSKIPIPLIQVAKLVMNPQPTTRSLKADKIISSPKFLQMIKAEADGKLKTERAKRAAENAFMKSEAFKGYAKVLSSDELNKIARVGFLTWLLSDVKNEPLTIEINKGNDSYSQEQ